MKTLSSLLIMALALAACITPPNTKRTAEIKTVNLKNAKVIESKGTKIYLQKDLVVVSLMGDLKMNKDSADVHIGNSRCTSFAENLDSTEFFSFYKAVPVQNRQLVADKPLSSLQRQILAVTTSPNAEIAYVIDNRVNSVFQCGHQNDTMIGGKHCLDCDDCRRATCPPSPDPWHSISLPVQFSNLDKTYYSDSLKHFEQTINSYAMQHNAQ